MDFDAQEPTLFLPRPQILTPQEFVQILEACTPSHEHGFFVEHIASCHQAMIWLFYDTGIRASELLNLRIADFDRDHGLITIKGTGANHRRIALGHNCLHNILLYIDDHRPTLTAFATQGSRDHLFLSERGQPMTEQDLSIVLASLAKRAGITGKSLHPSIFRDTFAVRSLELGHNPIALWYVLGKISMTKMKEYIEMSKTSIASTKYTALASQSEPRVQRRRGFRFKK